MPAKQAKKAVPHDILFCATKAKLAAMAQSSTKNVVKKILQNKLTLLFSRRNLVNTIDTSSNNAMYQILYLFSGLFMVLFYVSAQAFSISDLASPMRPPSKHNFTFDYKKQNQDRMEDGGGRGKVSLYQKGPHALSLTGKYRHMSVVPNGTGITDLFESDFGMTYSYEVNKEKQYSATISYGSQSDEPFKNSSVNTLNVSGIYSFSNNPKSRWTLILNYSNNRPFLNNIPLPYFAYTYIASKDFIGSFGAPFASIFWRFAPKWNLNLFTIVPWVLKAQVGYSLWGPIQTYGGIDFSQSSYFQYGRSNDEERLFYEESKVFVGVKSFLSRKAMVNLEVGHSFNRTFFFAENYSPNPDAPIGLDSSLYGLGTLSLFF